MHFLSFFQTVATEEMRSLILAYNANEIIKRAMDNTKGAKLEQVVR